MADVGESSDQRPEGAGWAELSPISFLLRTARIFPDRVAVRDGARTFTYRQHLDRACSLAGALRDDGIVAGDRVATLLPNVAEMLEAHAAVPGMGSVLVPLNTRLAAPEIARILEHSGTKLLIADQASAHVVADAIADLESPPRVVLVGETSSGYESYLAAATPLSLAPQNERALLSINYTSGTTGRPKGVMYTHRGAFLQTLGMVAESGLTASSSYLWTLPMFHCHGWAFTWAVTSMGATHVCLRQVDGPQAWALIKSRNITHLCGAPAVLSMLLDAPDAEPVGTGEQLRVYTGGAPPSPAVIERCEVLGWAVTHLYGLTETCGPIGVCVWHPEWNLLEPGVRARLKARQGVESVVSQPLRVVDEEMRDVPADGTSMGEIVMWGNNITIGYYDDEEQTAIALRNGHFHSGDIGVMHPDGYVEIRDRSKDIIISGGENISSIEVEQALSAHPDVAQVAVVGARHEKWGETPHAFVVLRPQAVLDPQQLREFARGRLAGYKLPGHITLVDELPTTSTGKVQKFLLRERAGIEPALPATDGL